MSQLKLILTCGLSNKVAKVYHNPDWTEYVIKFYIDSVYQVEADYFTTSKFDAIGTADTFIHQPN